MTRTFSSHRFNRVGVESLECVVSEHGHDLLVFSALVQGPTIMNIRIDTLSDCRVSFAMITEQFAHFRSALQAFIFEGRTEKELNSPKHCIETLL